MNRTSSNVQLWRLFVALLIVILAFSASVKYTKIVWTKPATGIDKNISGKTMCYNAKRGFNDYVSINSIRRDGLLDIDTSLNELTTAFLTYGKIRSIKGFIKVTGGYVEFKNDFVGINTKTITFTGGKEDFWDDQIIKNYIAENETDSRLETEPLKIPITKSDLHKTIIFNVRFDVVYPKLTGKNSFYNKEESVYQQYAIYVISKAEMQAMKEYSLWENRSRHIAGFAILALTALILAGFVIFYKRK